MRTAKIYKIERQRYNFQLDKTFYQYFEGTLAELVEKFQYNLEIGKCYQHERGAHKITMRPKTIDSLIRNLNNAEENRMANGAANVYYSLAD